ncbi:MAG: prepilin-type N-terminal cleavage/methylation domain-containing protein [Legionella sp.]|nr:prepilin-type N-terminal cleavage/methylation domain-containing protein [Legionella sp.]
MNISLRIKGFTLIELLFTMTILSVLTLIGTASFGLLKQKNEKQVMYDEIKTIVYYAKLKAIQLGSSVNLVPVDPELDWSKGMLLIQVEKKTNQKRRIQHWEWQHPNWHITWKGFQSSKQITFSNTPARSMSNGQFILQNKTRDDKLLILLNRLGRVRSTTDEFG